MINNMNISKGDARLEYGFEGIFIQSNIYEGDGTELIMPSNI